MEHGRSRRERRVDRALRARGLRARRAAGAAARGRVHRPLGRGHPAAHVRDAGCGRPRTVPAARIHHPGLPPASRPRRRGGRPSYAYRGPVFRLRTGETGEFLQAGIESIGRTRRRGGGCRGRSALALEGLDGARASPPACGSATWACSTRCSTRSRLAPAAKRRRHARHRLRPRPRGPRRAAPDSGIARACRPARRDRGPGAAGGRAFVEDILAIAGISTRRRAQRRRDRRALPGPAPPNRSAACPPRPRAVLSATSPSPAIPTRRGRDLRRSPRDAGLDLERGARRASRSAPASSRRAGLDVARFRFSAAFARNLDYYTGFIFEVARSAARRRQAGRRRRPLRPAAAAPRRADADSGRRLLVLARPHRGSGADEPELGRL